MRKRNVSALLDTTTVPVNSLVRVILLVLEMVSANGLPAVACASASKIQLKDFGVVQPAVFVTSRTTTPRTARHPVPPSKAECATTMDFATTESASAIDAIPTTSNTVVSPAKHLLLVSVVAAKPVKNVLVSTARTISEPAIVLPPAALLSPTLILPSPVPETAAALKERIKSANASATPATLVLTAEENVLKWANCHVEDLIEECVK